MIFDKTNPFMSTIKERKRLTGLGSTKDTYHISLDLKDSAITFKPGDSIAIFAQNDPILVSHLIHALAASGDEMIVDARSSQSMTFLTPDLFFFKALL
jgi:sulfite reductase (NADPH) flavoprotein alpha-component